MEVILPKFAEMWPSAIAFVLMFVLLWKFAFPPITAMLDKRADTIRESLEKAEDTRVEAERLMDEYKKQMAEARLESGRIVEQGRKVADSMKDDIVAKANEEAVNMIAKAKESIDAEKRAAMAELQASVADLSIAVAGKVIGKSMTVEDHAELIRQAMAEVGGLNG
jgi:F-type H+-transporting ATPase subunit b